MKVYLMAEGTWLIVVGKDQRPIESDSEDEELAVVKDWEQKDMKATASICMCFSRSILMEADLDSGSAGLWNWLEAKFGVKQEADVMHLYSQISTLKFDGQDLAAHISKLHEMYEAFAAAGQKYVVPER
ncbi:hypothetical protein R1flu_007405 [Riccia fluitans]|uniref:Uncharacterized protein n=1 Tax=Riccia fluitans TaxID=41844 RepID=A0ABD1YYS3_9MARC